MKKLFALMIALAMVSVMLPCIALADDAIDTSKHVVITYMVTGDKPTNKTDEVLGKINEILTEKVNAALEELIADGSVQAVIDKYITAE